TAAMLAILATYVIKSRQNEIVTWISAGQSVYRLLLPCLVATMLIGAANWAIQETLFTQANAIQDSLRTQIRSRGVVTSQTGRFWVYVDNNIISFDSTPASDNEIAGISKFLHPSASDNEIRITHVRLFQFSQQDQTL